MPLDCRSSYIAMNYDRIWLIGFMGTGKSSVGQIVAAQLHFSFLDTDELIESRAGRSVTEIFSQAGETMFRDLIAIETKALGPEHALTIRSHRGLANAFFNQGIYAAAEPEYREVLRLIEKVRGPDHTETLEACYDLAGNLARENKLPEAKDLARRAADTARKILGPTNPATQKYTKFLSDLETKNAL